MLITKEVQGHILLIGLNRADKMNAFSVDMLRQLADALTELEDDPNLRVGLLFAHGDHFTAGLDLGEVGPFIQTGEKLFPEDKVDPVQLFGRSRSKPLVMAVKGYCLTIAIELILASDICVAAPDCRFGQIEIKRGIFPFGGATIRMAQRCGWGNAMRYLLTGDNFDSQEAYRIGLVQEIDENAFARALAIAQTIADQAPLGVQASLLNARKAIEQGADAAKADLMPTLYKLMASDDAIEGLMSFVERRKANFKGK